MQAAERGSRLDLLKANAARIKYALELRQYTQSDVARECKVSRGMVFQVIQGIGRSKKVENRIAAITQIALEELWPQWHGPQAGRRRRSSINTSRAADTLRAVLG